MFLDSKIIYHLSMSLMVTCFLFLWSIKSLGAQPAPEPLVNRFLEQNQLLAVKYFESNLENLSKFIQCLDDSNTCMDANIIVSHGAEKVEIEFNQENLVNFIRARYSELRILSGVHSFSAIERGLAVGRGRMSISPVFAGGSLIYDIQSEAGAREWEQIQSIYKGELREIEFHNSMIQRSQLQVPLPSAEIGTMKKMIENQMQSLLQKFPFLKNLTRVNPERKDILKAFKKLKKSYINSLTHIATLEKEDRYELFGFISTLQSALDSFNPQERKLIEEHFKYIEETSTIWKQILDLVTSRYFLSMVGCWTTSVFIPPIAAICGAIGIGMAVPGIHKLAKQAIRLNDFNGTGEFERSVYGRYMTGMILSSGMYAIFLRSSVPSLVKNVSSIKESTKEVVKKAQLGARNVLGNRNDFVKGELDILKSYFFYNLKDYGSEGLVNLTSQRVSGVSMRQILPAINSAFQHSLLQLEARNPQVFFYSDILKITRSVLP